ncbi:MAG: SMC family ATPase [Nitrospirota bacterium]|nr:SMC family ATPase [Nitrospirota bacterium]
MRLKKILLHNFGWYKDAEIDLTDVQSAVVRGMNGTGKSTGFIDGPLAAFFGKCRASIDELMYPGADDMAIGVIFESNHQDYRVQRKRSLKTKRGKSELQLDVLNGEQWVPMSDGIDDAQAKIIDLLGADYELFTSTCFFLQGEIDQFTKALPSKRTATLTEILRLYQYKPLNLSAMRHVTVAETKHGEKAEQLTILEQAASTVDSLEARQTEVSAALVDSTKAIEQLETHQQSLTTLTAGLAAELNQLATIPGQIADLDAKQVNIQSSRQSMVARRERAAKILSERATIEAKVKEEREKRDEIAQLDEVLVGISGDVAALTQQLAHEQEQLGVIPQQLASLQATLSIVREQEKELVARRERAAKILSERATIEAKVKEEAGAKQLDALLERERTTLSQDATELVVALSEVRVQLSTGIELERLVVQAETAVDRQVQLYVQETARLDMALTDEKKRLEFLKTVPCGEDLQRRCPFTIQAVKIQEALPATEHAFQHRFIADQRSAIAPEACEALREALVQQSTWKKLDCDTTAKKLEASIQAVSAKQDNCEKRRAANRDYLVSLFTFTALMPELAVAEREVASIDRDLVQRMHTYSEYGREIERLELRAVERKKVILNVEAELTLLAIRKEECDTRQKDNRAALVDISRFTALVPELESAEREVIQVDADLARFSDDLSRIASDIAKLETCLADRARLTSEYDRLSSEFQQGQIYLTRLRSDSQTATGRLKELEMEIKSGQDAARKAETLRHECAALLTDKRHFQALATAYAQIPILIMETAIPLLEEESNRILDKISTTGMRIRFDTQKALKSREGMMETLEIIVRDFRGERRYELYSGAEKFKVDLAIRIGLSRLLASRSGSRLQTVIIDEGFGCLDPDGIVQLRESLVRLAEDFGLLLVITHVEALKDAFPSQLVVTSDANGSHVEVVR